MATVKINYSASTAVFSTSALDSLTFGTSYTTGYESNVIDNSSNLYDDVLLSGRFKTNNTAPTAGQIQVYIGTLLNDTEYPDVFDGTAGVETVTSSDIRNAILSLAVSLPTDTTANRVYEFTGVSVANLFGGIMPKKWFVWVTQNTNQLLNVTANNGGQVWYTGITYTVT